MYIIGGKIWLKKKLLNRMWIKIRSAPRVFNYIIEYYDIYNQNCISDTVFITVINQPPTSYPSEDFTIAVGDILYLEWYLYDDFGGGLHRIIKTDARGISEELRGWRTWSHAALIFIILIDIFW